VPQGAEGSPTDDTSVEVMMDVQIVAAMAQGANIMLYFAQWSQRGWVNLLKHIVHSGGQKPNVISISYGVSEESGDFSASAMNVINGYFMEAANMGITICVSAGDDGCGSLDFDGKYHANFPATSPNVMAIGGTMIDYSGANPQEVTWWETPGRRFDQNNNSTGGGSTGGGVSTVFSRPTWQTVTTASLNDGSTTGRCVPDVSALAGPPFYYLIFNGQTSPNGGTSAAAPMWASVLAVLGAAGKKINFFTPVLYGMDTNGKTIGQNVCNDITIGNNASNPPATGYQAGPGYDAVTGWGTPNVTAMINNPNI
jgi:kumamolisin